MNLLIDRPALTDLRWLRNARGRVYYIAEPPVLGILVIRWDARLEEIVGLVADTALGYEPGVGGWCAAGYEGQNHGKATLYKIVDIPHDLTLSSVLATWRERYPM